MIPGTPAIQPVNKTTRILSYTALTISILAGAYMIYSTYHQVKFVKMQIKDHESNLHSGA